VGKGSGGSQYSQVFNNNILFIIQNCERTSQAEAVVRLDGNGINSVFIGTNVKYIRGEFRKLYL